jgi:hypothetical protein
VDEDFLSSLLCAVGEFLGDVALGSVTDVMVDPVVDTIFGHDAPTAIAHHVSSPWATALSRPGVAPVGRAANNHGVGAIRENDPAFDIREFLIHVGEMFEAFHRAADNGDLASTRRFIDETYYAEIEPVAEKTGRRAGGARTFTIKAIRPETASHDEELDLIRVLISARDNATDEVLCEYWELVRKRGTLTKPGLTITKCPNCGAPVDGLDPTRCAYCDTRLADPALDWVVRKITEQ